MGRVDIPDHPPPGGSCRAELILEPNELRVTIDLLKAVLNKFTHASGNGVVTEQEFMGLSLQPQTAERKPSSASSSSASAPNPQAAPAPVSRVAPAPTPVPAPAAARPAATAAAGGQKPGLNVDAPAFADPDRAVAVPKPIPQPAPAPHQPPPQQQQQQAPPRPAVPAPLPIPLLSQVGPPQPALQAVQPLPAVHPAAVRAVPPPIPAPVPTPAPVPAPAVPAAAAAAPRERLRLCYTSDAGDHNNSSVVALAYAPSLQGLPGGDAHGGWLISSSKGVLNLFECNPGGGKGGEAPLLLMHSQEGEDLGVRLALAAKLQMMYVVAFNMKNQKESICVHSLNPEHLLAPRFKFEPPPQAGRPQQRMLLQCVNAHGLNPQLSNCCIASYQDRLVVFDAKREVRPGTVIRESKLSWVGHKGSLLTALSRSTVDNVVFSGASDGSVHMWTFRERPKDDAPAARFKHHTGSISSVIQVHDTLLVTGSMDGTVCFWDIKSPASPKKVLRPDGSAVLHMALSPFADVLAVATSKALYALDVFEPEEVPRPLLLEGGKAPERPFADLAWNSSTQELYAAGHNGIIHVFSRLC